MNTAAATSQTIELKKDQGGSHGLKPGYFARRNVWDWLFAAFVIVGAGWAFTRYNAAMDGYEKAILVGAVPAMIWLGWFWRPLRALAAVVAAVSLLAIWLYQTPTGTADLARADQVFMLKYFISSQSAILWMSVLFFMSTAFYWVGMFKRAGDTFELLGSRMAWVAVTLALIGTMVRCTRAIRLAPTSGTSR